MKIIGNTVVLRDLRKEDIQRRLLWETEQTEWQQWDAPWEYEEMEGQVSDAWLRSYRQRLENRVEELRRMDESKMRRGFEIALACGGEESIGWCSSYFLGDDYTPDPDGGRLAVGIDLPAPESRGKGYGTQALALFLDYLFSAGFSELYTQTWSGNFPMIHVAGNLGFHECARKKGIRRVHGKNYDALTFCLAKSSFLRKRGNR